MSKYRQAARVDDNQAEIVRQLRSIPGVTVVPGHDDLIVGFNGKTLWVEVKAFNCYSKTNGELLESKKRVAQKKLDATFTGARIYAHCIEDILRWFSIKIC